MKNLLKSLLILFSIYFYSCNEEDNGAPSEPNLVLIEFSANTANGSELTGENLPVILVSGSVVNEATVNVILSTSAPSSAEGNGVDYTFDSPQTITVPIGEYDGTLVTAISIPTLAIVDDDLEEAIESFSLRLDSPTGDLEIGTINSFTYSIIDDDSQSVSFSQSFGSDKESVGGNLPMLLITGNFEEETVVTISNTSNGTATLSEDYSIESPLEIIIPEGSYDGYLRSLGIHGINVG